MVEEVEAVIVAADVVRPCASSAIRRSVQSQRSSRRMSAMLGTVLALAIAQPALAGDLTPPWEEMKTLTDKQEIVSVHVPVDWVDGGPTGERGSITQFYGGFPTFGIDGTGPLRLSFRSFPGYGRPGLVRYLITQIGETTVVPDTIVTGEGWIQEDRIQDGGTMCIRRIWSKDGVVYEAIGICHESVRKMFRDHIDEIFDSVKIVGAVELPQPPAGFEKIEKDGFEIWTDAPKHKGVKRVLKLAKQATAMIANVLPGKAADPNLPRLILCKSQAEWKKIGSVENVGGDTMAAFPHAALRAGIVWLEADPPGEVFERETIYAINSVLVRHYFHGSIPRWLSVGCGVYIEVGIGSKKKPQRPIKKYVTKGRGAVEAAEGGFDGMFGLSGLDPVDEVGSFSTWAWLHYFLHGDASKEQAAAFKKYVKVLRETARPELAAAVWDDIDKDKMNTEFTAWAAKWK